MTSIKLFLRAIKNKVADESVLLVAEHIRDNYELILSWYWVTSVNGTNILSYEMHTFLPFPSN